MWIALITVAVCVCGILLATPDGSGLLQPLDDVVARTVRSAFPTPLVAALRAITFVDTIGGASVAALVGVAVIGRLRRRHALAGAVACAAAATITVVFVAQQFVARPDPRAGTAGLSASVSSFPGSCVAVAVGAATVALIHTRGSGSRRRAPIVLLAAAAALTLSSLVVGTHWLSDDLAAAVVGTSVGLVVTRASASTRRHRARQRLAPRTVRRLGLAVALITVPPVAVSYWGALQAPGYAATDARTVDWLRTHGLGTVVDRAESWWLFTHLPSTTDQISSLPAPPIATSTTPATRPGAPTSTKPVGAQPAATTTAAPPTQTIDVPAALAPLTDPALPNEGRWTVALANPQGATQIATTSIRPDPLHPALVATLAWMNTATVRFALVAGTRQPVGHPGPWNATVPDALRSNLLATFNSGYKMRDTPGGALIEGVQARQLKQGIATLAVRADGTATVGEWGHDIPASTQIVAARQNLHLIITNGLLVPGLRTNVGQLWGTVKNALPTWRSGIGVDHAGNLIYASGNQLTIDTLATALQRAGAVTAMELDIHNHMVTYNLFTHTPGSPKLVGHKLSPDMTESATRYLQPDQRDFVAVFSR